MLCELVLLLLPYTLPSCGGFLTYVHLPFPSLWLLQGDAQRTTA
jgi:hypothetical protein